MLSTETINQLLKINDSYKAPQALMNILLDKERKNDLFETFLRHESDLSYEWFQGYFEEEQADRKNKKQDFTPHSISNLLAKLVGANGSYFEAAAGTGGIMIQQWVENEGNNCWYHLEELSDRAIPFLLFNMAIRGMNGIVCHGDSLTNDFKAIYRIANDGQFSKVVQQNDI